MSAVVLEDQESNAAFATRLSQNDIQTIWVEIDNQSNEEFLLMLFSIDPDYYSPSEAAWTSRRFGERRSRQKMELFAQQHVPLVIPANEKTSGFVFVNHDPGFKAFAVHLMGQDRSLEFDFVQAIPGLNSDFARNRPLQRYEGAALPNLTMDQFRAYLADLPCCALGSDQRTEGDPLNIVFVGDGELLLTSLVREGWDPTEVITFATAWRTVMSSLFKSNYRTSPISPLFLFDRAHDLAFQKTRGNINERNHLRLWKAPIRVSGEEVWVGQVSRDIGVKFSRRTLVTHRIDPDVDEARFHVFLNMISSQSVEAVAFSTGVGKSSRANPRRNFTRDPYYTDGLRAVFFLDPETRSFDEIDILEWEDPGILGLRGGEL